MKVCSIETTNSSEKILSHLEKLRSEEPFIIILTPFDWMKESLEEISRFLIQNQQTEALHAIDTLKEECISMLVVPDTDEANTCATKADITAQIDHFVHLAKSHSEASYQQETDIRTTGGYLSAILCTAYLKYKGMNASLLDASEFIQLNEEQVPDIDFANIQTEPGKIYVMPTNIYRNESGEPTYLIDMYTDLYALYVAIALQAKELTLIMPTQGLHSLHHKEENKLCLTCEEAAHMLVTDDSHISHSTLFLAREKQISIRLISDNQANLPAIYIDEEKKKHDIKAITVRKDINYLRMSPLGKIPSSQVSTQALGILVTNLVPIYLFTSSSTNISVAIRVYDIFWNKILNKLSRFAKVTVEKNVTAISILGEFDWNISKVEARIIDLLKDIPILMISYGSDNQSISVVVREKDTQEVLRILSKYLSGVEPSPQSLTFAPYEDHSTWFV
ncbi:hypothetical protein WKU26_00095 [Phocaeicola sp. HCN-40430]|uniref:ACT domain-containing protein n=1 Tax=Phocaeicola sp. HCN-40430 TaxID=3134664 RepID=UPI0030C4780C